MTTEERATAITRYEQIVDDEERNEMRAIIAVDDTEPGTRDEAEAKSDLEMVRSHLSGALAQLRVHVRLASI